MAYWLWSPVDLAKQMEPRMKQVNIRVENLTVSFGSVKVLDKVSFEISSGKVLALLGGNGSGKTTLLNAISGLIPCEGRVIVDGRDVSALPTWARSRAGLARSFQSSTSFRDLSIAESVAIRRWCRSQRSRDMVSPVRRIASMAMAIVRLAAQQSPKSSDTRSDRHLFEVFSGNPRIVLLDEPLAGRSNEARAWLRNILKRYQEAGGSALVVEHRIEEILPMVDSVLVLEGGKVNAEPTSS